MKNLVFVNGKLARDLDFFGVFFRTLPALNNDVISAGSNYFVSARSDDV